MFKILKIILSLIILFIVAGIAVYFLPKKVKVQGMEALSGFIPSTIKDKTKEFLLTPPQKRELLLEQLEDNLKRIEKNPQSEESQTALTESATLIHALKEKNNEASFTEIIKTKLVEQFLENEKGDETVSGQCSCDKD